jgi:hypothetical protein
MDILHCASDNPEATYGLLQFSEVNLAGVDWHNQLTRLRVDSTSHARLLGVLVHHPDTFASAARFDTVDIDITPWFESTNNIPPHIGQSNNPMDKRSIATIATLVKIIRQPNTDTPKYLRFFIVPSNKENITADDPTRYNDCEANTIHITIDIQDNGYGFTTTALPGETSVETRLLITLATCAT